MKHLLGEANEQEQQQVKKWLADDSSNMTYYVELKKVWDASKQLAASSTVDAEAAWERFQNRIEKNKISDVPVRRIGFPWKKIAAAAIIVFGLIAFQLFYTGKPAKEILVQTQANILKDTLSDGSVITLNKNSSIAYNSIFKGKTRNITLKGEAFFNVAPDKKKPFIISVNDIQVTVVGTSFNIKSNNGSTEVVVETGVVKVTKNGKTVELRANEKIEVATKDSVLVKEEVNDKLYNYYRTKEFVCDDTPLWKLIQVVNEAYNTTIIIGRNELRDLRMNTTFNNESLEQVLNVISLTFSIKVIKEGDKIILQ